MHIAETVQAVFSSMHLDSFEMNIVLLYNYLIKFVFEARPSYYLYFRFKIKLN